MSIGFCPHGTIHGCKSILFLRKEKGEGQEERDY